VGLAATHEGIAEMRRSLSALNEARWLVRTFEFAPLVEMCGKRRGVPARKVDSHVAEATSPPVFTACEIERKRSVGRFHLRAGIRHLPELSPPVSCARGSRLK